MAGATAGVLFGSSDALGGARRQVVIAGRRVNLKQLYFDALVFTPEGLRHLVAECGTSQIVLGTDAPFPGRTTAVDHVLGTRALSDADKVAILGGNLIKLLRLDPVS